MLEASTALPPGLAGGSPAGRGTLLDPPLDIAAAVAVLAADAPARWRGPLLPPTAQGHQGNAHPLCGLSLREQVVIPQGLHPGYLRDLSLTLEITQGSLRASEMEVPRRMRQHPPRRGHEETASCPPHPLARPGATPPRRTRPSRSFTTSSATPARPMAAPTAPRSSSASAAAPPRSAATSAGPASGSTRSSTPTRGTSRRSSAATRSTTTSAPMTSRSGSGGSGGAGDHPQQPGPAPGAHLQPGPGVLAVRPRRLRLRRLLRAHPRHRQGAGHPPGLARAGRPAMTTSPRSGFPETSPETSAALAGRVEALEADNARLRELARHLTSAVELLAEQAGARPATTEPDRPQLELIIGGAS